jgi:uncharacterized membrane protein YphA (DoxX/SURF4 family)
MTRSRRTAATYGKSPGGGQPARSPTPGQRGGGAPVRPARTWDRISVQILERFGAVTAAWAPTAARLLLGLVLLWFGYHELVTPGLWTGYVPVLSTTSHAAEVLVLAHGWVLLVIAVALLGGVAPRLAAAVAALLLLEIVISLAVTGVTDLVLRDVGVLGLAIAVTGATRQRLLLLR